MECYTTVLADYVSKFIDAKYVSISHNTAIVDYDGRSNNKPVDWTTVPASVEVNGYTLSALVSQIPDASVADITEMLENLKSLDAKTKVVGWGIRTVMTSYGYTTSDSSANLGTLVLSCESIWDEYYCEKQTYTVEIKIDNVIHTNHKFYYLTKKLEDWLRVEGKPRRKAAFETLFM